MAVLKGGRGHKAPYSSTHVRVPEPIKPFIEDIVEMYRLCVVDEQYPPDEAAKEVVNRVKGNIPNLDEAHDIAQKIVYQGESARMALTKLLTALYGQKLDKNFLKAKSQKD